MQVKCRLQSQSAHFKAVDQHAYQGLFSGLRSIYRESGVAGLYQGVSAVMLRLFVGSAAQMASYDVCKTAIMEQGKSLWGSANRSLLADDSKGRPRHVLPVS